MPANSQSTTTITTITTTSTGGGGSSTVPGSRPTRVIAALLVLLATLGVVLAGPPPSATAATAPPPAPVPSVANAGGFVNVPAVRLADTRAAGPNQGCVTGVKRLTLPSWLADAATVSALVVNVTVVDPTADGFLRLTPAGSPVPRSVHINYSAGRSIANQVTIRPTATAPADVVRKLDVWVSGGCPNVLIDLVGLHAQLVGGSAATGGLRAIEPARVLDTRSAAPCVGAPRRVQVAGVAGVPAEARSVVLNATALGASNSGAAVVSPVSVGAPTSAPQTVQYRPAASVTNAVTTALDPTGGLWISATSGCPNLILDVLAWHSGGDLPATGGFVGVTPRRLLDTRTSGGCITEVRNLRLHDIQEASAVSVALNVTVVDPPRKGWLTVHSGGAAAPSVASVQFAPGERIAHGLTVEPGSNASIDIRSFGGGCTHVVVDLVGTYAPPRALDVQVGDQHTCVRAAGTTLQLRCWGSNSIGQLAQGPGVTAMTSPSTVAMGSDPLALSLGDDHTCAVLGTLGTPAGNVYCAGANESGQLGDPTAWNREYTLRASTFTGAIAVASGPSHTCAIVGADRQVHCVGANDDGQAPAVATVPAVAPSRPLYCSFLPCLDASGLGPTPLTGVRQVAVGGRASCAVLDSGRVRCWGRGVMGDPTLGGSAESVEVPGVAGVIDLSVGEDHACAVMVVGQVSCWGSNGRGQLGVGPAVAASGPVAVSLPGFSGLTRVSAGAARTCVVGSIWTPAGQVPRLACWGENSTGAIGDGTTTDRWTPTIVPIAGRTMTAVDTGTSHTCAVVDDRVQCWGANTNGQLGNGTRSGSPWPVTALD